MTTMKYVQKNCKKAFETSDKNSKNNQAVKDLHALRNKWSC